MKIYYRISDNSYKKYKLPGATKEFCLKNFLQCFNDQDITIIADNVTDETFAKINEIANSNEITRTNFSNAGSLSHALHNSISLPDNTVVYFVEDDYLHFKGISPFGSHDPVKIIEEGLSIGDYVTLYDHPDKYQEEYNYGEVSACFKLKHSHWRTTISTCMTFATTVKTLKNDLGIWEVFTRDYHPHDHLIFTSLNTKKGRNLMTCIPGLACHVDLTYSFNKGLDNLFDQWVIDLLEVELSSQLKEPVDVSAFDGYKKLMLLDGYLTKQITS